MKLEISIKENGKTQNVLRIFLGICTKLSISREKNYFMKLVLLNQWVGFANFTQNVSNITGKIQANAYLEAIFSYQLILGYLK